MSAPDVVIIGGGVVGCATGYALANAGARVTIIERDGIASHASGFSFGGLYPTMGAGIPGPLLDPAKDAVRLHRELYPRLRDETGIDYELRQVESINLVPDAAGLAGLRKDCDWQKSQAFDAEVLSTTDVYELEPSLAPGLAGGLLQRSHYELDSYKFTLALAQGAERLGGRIVSAEVVALEIEKEMVTGVRTRSGSAFPAGAVVIASGPWAGSPPVTTAGFPLPKLPVHPVKGEILRLRLPGKDFRHRCGMNGRNVARKPDGLVWVGTTEWERGFDSTPSVEGRDHIMSGALAYAPALAGAELVQHTACLRPLAADGLPVVGPVNAAHNLFTATAAGKKGVLLSLIMAKWVTGLVSGDALLSPVPRELSTARFHL